MTVKDLQDRALNIVRQRGRDNQQEALRRRQEVEAKLPKLNEYMEKRQRLLQNAIAMIGSDQAPVGVAKAITGLNMMITAFLESSGFPKDYLDPIVSCDNCMDSGYQGQSTKTLCYCVKREMVGLTQANAPREERFDTFDETVFSDTPLPGIEGVEVSQRRLMKIILKRCRSYADQLPQPKPPHLLLYGPSGLGKSFLLNAIYHEATDRQIPALRMDANSLLNHIRRVYFSREGETLDFIYQTPLLLIDDLGTEPMLANITVEQLFALIEYRLNKRLPTVISTNLRLPDILARYTERISSRLTANPREFQVLEFQGEDIRSRLG